MQNISTSKYPVLDMASTRNWAQKVIDQLRGKLDMTHAQNITTILASQWPFETIWSYIGFGEYIMDKKRDIETAMLAIGWFNRAYDIEKKYNNKPKAFHKVVEYYLGFTHEKDAVLSFIHESPFFQTYPQDAYNALSKTYGMYNDFEGFNKTLNNASILNLDVEELLSRFLSMFTFWRKKFRDNFNQKNLDAVVQKLQAINPNNKSILVYEKFTRDIKMLCNNGTWLSSKVKRGTWISPKAWVPEPLKPIDWNTLYKQCVWNLNHELKRIEQITDETEIFYFYRRLCMKRFSKDNDKIQKSVLRHKILLEHPKLRYFLLAQLSRVNQSGEISWLKKLVQIDTDQSAYYNYEILQVLMGKGIFGTISLFLSSTLHYFKNSPLGVWVIFNCVLRLLKLWHINDSLRVMKNMPESSEKETLSLVIKVKDESMNRKKVDSIIAFINRTDIQFSVPIIIAIIHLCSEFLSHEHPLYQTILWHFPQLTDRALAATLRNESEDDEEMFTVIPSMNRLWNDSYIPIPIDRVAREVVSPWWSE